MEASTQTLWQKCLSLVRQMMPSQHFTAWFEPLEFVSFRTGKLTLLVPTKYFAEFFDQHYAPYLLRAAMQTFGSEVKLQYKLQIKPPSNPQPEPILKDGKSKHTAASTPYDAAKHAVPPLDPQLNPRYTFETFVEGVSNRLARSVAKKIAEQPGTNSFNPFFLYGPSGVGKTHLVNAIGVKIRELAPSTRVLFVSAHLFKTQYTDSVIHNTQNDFLNFYQSIEVLIIDDIQEITTAKTQQAFFHIFNHLQQNGRQIIITCDRPPVLLQGLEERMLTRFKWGMTAEIEKPDTCLRRDILRAKIKRDKLNIPSDVVQYIAQSVESSVREIEGIINSLMAYSVVDNCEIDLALAQRVVARAVNLERRELTADDITQAVCQHYGVKVKEITSKSRKQNFVAPRQLAMYLCHKYTQLTYSHIGRLFGKRDHSTVLYACTQAAKRINTDVHFRREVEELEATFKSAR